MPEKLEHREPKQSTGLWFVAGLIPIVNLYFLWKAAECISGHEKAVKEYEFLDHRKVKGSTTGWFILLVSPVILCAIAMVLIFTALYEVEYYYFYSYTTVSEVVLGTIIIFLIGIPLALYGLWKMAEVVSGHEKIYKRYETLGHKKKKDSTFLWFVIGMVPFLGLYLIWKVAEVISGHEKIFK